MAQRTHRHHIDIDKELYTVIGIITYQGVVENARLVKSNVCHTEEEKKRGKPWRFNMWSQEFGMMPRARNEDYLHRNDYAEVIKYLVDHDYADPDDRDEM